MGQIAALFVETGGAYFGLPGVDPWDEARDARLYAGPWPVVAHPPCQRWGKLWAGQPLHIKRTGERKIKGDDGGCFAAALHAVRTFGGVLEHPWGSHAWPHFNLNVPPRTGGWIAADLYGGWTCCVEQGRYGHYARKPTLLYTVGCELPELDWGESEARLDPAIIQRMGLKRAKRLGEVGGPRRREEQRSAHPYANPIPRSADRHRPHRYSFGGRRRMTPFQSLQMELQLMLNEPVSHAARPPRVVKLNPEFARRHHLGAVTRPQAEKRILNDARLAYDYRQRGRG